MTAPTYIMGTAQTKAYRILREHVYTALEDHDLNPTYWSMLGIIMNARDGVRLVDIANILHVKAPLVTAMAKDLEASGYVQSVRNQFDARAKLLAITPVGKSFIKSVEGSLITRLSQLLIGVTESDMATYHKVLTTIIINDSEQRKQVKNKK